jgi:S-DNA-T family DNA segregation ATPase FtsK/SpoIIIE
MENKEIFQQQFSYFGLEVKFVKESNNAIAQTLYYDLVDINHFNPTKITNIVEKMSLYNHCKLEWKKGTDSHIVLTMYYQNPTIYLSNLLAEDNFNNIVIGLDTEGNKVKLDFDKIPHLLIAGTTGSGKSVLLRNLLINLYGWYAKSGNRFKECEVVIIDMKREFERYGNLYGTTFIGDSNQAITKLKECCDIMDYRYAHKDQEYKDLFIVVDELSDLMLKSRFEVEDSIIRIAQLGRACHIHLILATQYPKAEVCTGLIKSNMPYRICLKTASIRESVVVMDKKCCEELNVGEAYFKNGVEFTRLKVAFPHNELEQKMFDTYSRIRQY